ncbi:MAG: NUDIX domain-containing protein [Gemmatimonadales bacterium]
MTEVRVSIVDVYPVRRGAGGLELLVLRRAPGGRCAGSWESVHGHVETGERPADAALRELREESGLRPSALYNLSRVECFYQHRLDEVALVPVFVALVEPEGVAVPGGEHDALEWLSFPRARERLAWPRERRALEDIEVLLGSGSAGALEDVLRVC